MRILIADDDKAYLDSLRMLLETLGHVVETAHDGSAGLDSANRRPFDLLIADFRMPDFNGVELFKKIGRLQPAIEGILVSGEMNDARKNEAVEAGMLVGFHKLHEANELRTLILAMTRHESREIESTPKAPKFLSEAEPIWKRKNTIPY